MDAYGIPDPVFSCLRSGYGTDMKWTRLIGVMFAAAAVLAVLAGVRLIVLHRVPDGTLSLGLAVALGTSGIMLMLVDRQMPRRSQRVLANR